MAATYKVLVAEDGRLIVPQEAQQVLGLRPGIQVTLRIDHGELHADSHDAALTNAQDLVARYTARDVSLADDLIRERHEASEKGCPSARQHEASPPSSLLAP